MILVAERKQQYRYYTYNGTLRRFRVPTVAVEKQYVSNNTSKCL